ncbi:Putative LysR family transcriptional regulator [Rhizobium freirei PRF 81]|uniref:HTH-type transcriptional regulator TtuA n=1 Tax=Rhizobium freirei PRF 81 TaxID=363754 RepID=N6TWY9_9HYPH|nr:Putative LysR family transcriptional regulator [Rhizobium freirei PRF 81]
MEIFSLDLSSIEIFLAVANDRSVTKAAKTIGRVPSNVTTRIQQLEDHLGVLLFSRDGKKMTLTKEGETFLSYANRLAALALEARQAVRPERPTGTLRLGTMESTAASRLPAALSQFNQMWPDVSLQLTLGASRDLARDVLRDVLDCALIARPPEAMLNEDAALTTNSSSSRPRRCLSRIYCWCCRPAIRRSGRRPTCGSDRSPPWSQDAPIEG